MAYNGIKTSEDILAEIKSFQKSRILLTAFELKVFTHLGSHMMTSDELAVLLNCNSAQLEKLLNALTAMEYLRKTNGKFYNSRHASEYLVEGKPDFLAGIGHINNMWNSWSNLTSKIIDPKLLKRTSWEENFIAAMDARGKKQSELLPFLIETQNVNLMLDVGGGSGIFSIGFIRANNNIKSVILDLPGIIPITKKYLKGTEFQNHFDFIEGDYHTADFKHKYDLIFLSAIVHINSFEENEALMIKCANHLTENGKVVINDFVMNEDKTEPERGAVFAINMLAGTKNGTTYSFNEMVDWFKSTNLKSIRRKETSFGTTLVIVSK